MQKIVLGLAPKAELVRAVVASIAYQIADIVFLMKEASGLKKWSSALTAGRRKTAG